MFLFTFSCDVIFSKNLMIWGLGGQGIALVLQT